MDDIDAVTEDDIMVGTMEREDGTVVVITVTAFANEADAEAYMDEIHADMTDEGQSIH